MKVLSDRLLAKQAKAVDGYRTMIGRYNQILFDGSPIVMNQIRKEIKIDKNVLKVDFFRVKDFYNFAQEYTKPVSLCSNSDMREGETLIRVGDRKTDVARRIAILKEESY